MKKNTTDDPRNKELFVKIIRYVFVSAIVMFVANSLLRALITVDWKIITFAYGKLLLGTVLVLSSACVASFVYMKIYAILGNKLSLVETFILATVPPLGKYIPGKVMSLVGHASLAKLFGIRLAVAGFAALLFIIVGLSSGVVLGVLLIYLGQYNLVEWKFANQLLLLAVVPTIIILVWPNLYWNIVNVALERFRKRSVNVQFTFSTNLIMFIGLFFVNGLFIGGSVLAGLGVTSTDLSLLPIVVGIACFANVSGYLVLFSPGGIGIRDGILYYLLITIMDESVAALLTVVLRVLQTVADVFLAIVGTSLLMWLKANKKSVE
ncbi:MAG: hypothetical protein GY705_08820 [Bacteroidetes bacterium]|nr:hypothetical protein [Bacteroidota bacterium]